jgi:hypothetical protein
MLIRPKFKIMTPKQAEDYYARLQGSAIKNVMDGAGENNYYRKRLKEIITYAESNNITTTEAVIKLTTIKIGDSEDADIKEVETGVYFGSWINIEHEFDYDLKLSFENIQDDKFKHRSGYTSYPSEFDYMIPFDYGVCDSPAQFLEYQFTPGDWARYVIHNKNIEITPEIEKSLDTKITLGDYLRNSERKFAVGFHPMIQDKESEGGGWRWHKWGQYIGKHDIKCEYLDDEDLSDISQDFILCFHIYEFKDAEEITTTEEIIGENNEQGK